MVAGISRKDKCFAKLFPLHEERRQFLSFDQDAVIAMKCMAVASFLTTVTLALHLVFFSTRNKLEA